MGGTVRGHDAPLAAGGPQHRGRPGLAWEVALYVPWVVLMLVQPLHAGAMEGEGSRQISLCARP